MGRQIIITTYRRRSSRSVIIFKCATLSYLDGWMDGERCLWVSSLSVCRVVSVACVVVVVVVVVVVGRRERMPQHRGLLVIADVPP
jgi:hypothetical protein